MIVPSENNSLVSFSALRHQKRGTEENNDSNEESRPPKTSKIDDYRFTKLLPNIPCGHTIHPVTMETLRHSQQKTPVTFEVKNDTEFKEFIEAFSGKKEPDEITFECSSFNLTEAYDTFWSSLIASGFTLKNNFLSDKHLIGIAKILKRGWEDEHYFPRKLSKSCLEVCLFNREEDMKYVTELWTPILAGLLELEEFEFLMNPPPKLYIRKEAFYENYIPPHRLWNTYFYGWEKGKIEYYFELVSGTSLLIEECPECIESPCGVEHFVSCCKKNLKYMFKERHDCVMKIIEKELNLAVERKKGFFVFENDWNTNVMYQNVRYEWPDVFGKIYTKKYPHIVVFCTKPEKQVLIIELCVSREKNMRRRKIDKTDNYKQLKKELERKGFKVKFKVVVMGSRGVVDKHLYNLFKKIFGMKHSEISRAMEKISKKIITVSYNDYQKFHARDW